MKFLYFAAAATALRIPAGLPSGTYMVGPDSAGNSITKHLNGTIVGVEPGSSPVPKRNLEKRGHVTFCGCGIGVDHSNCDSAVQALKDHLGDGATVNAGYSILVIDHDGGSQGASVAAFACNAGYSAATASATDVAWAATAVTNSCGWYIAGTVQKLGDYNSVLDFGYMNYYDGLDICANAETSFSTSC